MEKKDIVTCEYCGCEQDWQDGNVYYCEKCNKLFCKHCFMDKLSLKDWLDNLSNEDLLCPDCYQ